jgi:DNA excision repair protein ERCC-2
LKINHSTKELKISIRELAQILLVNSNEGNKSIGLSNRIRASIGRDIHKDYQDKIQQTKQSAKTEYHVKYSVVSHGWTVHLNGRVDVVYEENGKLIVEEIKSTTEIFDPMHEIRKDHIKQLQLYAQAFLHRNNKVVCNMVIYDILKDKYHKIRVKTENQLDFINKQVKSIIDLYERTRKENHSLKKRSGTVKFPFEDFRTNQERLIELATNTLKAEKSILISAPSEVWVRQ